mmetsp:Transcript_32403/g.103111  ORF Transcript_32403/g.103111 Transcript_32403/m.103111 type:complete len:237 (+) Transcript_32403:405-1115(+)
MRLLGSRLWLYSAAVPPSTAWHRASRISRRACLTCSPCLTTVGARRRSCASSGGPRWGTSARGACGWRRRATRRRWRCGSSWRIASTRRTILGPRRSGWPSPRGSMRCGMGYLTRTSTRSAPSSSTSSFSSCAAATTPDSPLSTALWGTFFSRARAPFSDLWTRPSSCSPVSAAYPRRRSCSHASAQRSASHWGRSWMTGPSLGGRTTSRTPRRGGPRPTLRRWRGRAAASPATSS